MERHTARGNAGFTYIALLILLAVMGIGFAATGPLIHQSLQREDEDELLYVGEQIRLAIMRYYESSPGIKRYPRQLEELVDDPRFPATRRHLRRLYRDPITRSEEWGLVMAPEGGIMGVYSRSEAPPIKSSGFPRHLETFAEQRRYRDWVFVYQPAVRGR